MKRRALYAMTAAALGALVGCSGESEPAETVTETVTADPAPSETQTESAADARLTAYLERVDVWSDASEVDLTQESDDELYQRGHDACAAFIGQDIETVEDVNTVIARQVIGEDMTDEALASYDERFVVAAAAFETICPPS